MMFSKLKKEPKQQRSRETAELILIGARKALARFGYRASIANIVRTIGVSPGSFYQYFSNREALFEELSKRIFHGTEAQIYEKLEESRGKPDYDRLNAVMGVAIDRFMAHAEVASQLMKLANSLGLDQLIYQTRARVQVVLEGVLVNEFGREKAIARYQSFYLVNSLVGVMHSYMPMRPEGISEVGLKEFLVDTYAKVLDFEKPRSSTDSAAY